ncbi:MAG: Holliday junction resolvase RuvX, partial [Microthrixaceae bacterium]
MRAIGVDLGSKRIGLSVCDSAGAVAVPLQTLERSRKWAVDHAA